MAAFRESSEYPHVRCHRRPEDSRGWLIAFGALCMLAGALALAYATFATQFVILYLAGGLIAIGAVRFAGAFWMKNRSDASAMAMLGLVGVALGLLIAGQPYAAEVSLTIIVCAAILAGGLMRIAFASTIRFPNWGWMFAGGVISVLLGIALLSNWMVTSTWLLGTIIGVDLLFDGASWLALGLIAGEPPDALDRLAD